MTTPAVLRAGVTLIEVAVAVAVIAVVAGAAYFSLASPGDRERVAESADILRTVAVALNKFDTATGAGTYVNGRYPMRLYHLANEITTGTTDPTSRTSCRAPYVASHVTGWRNAGPFLQREITANSGFRIPIGIVRDTVFRTPPDSGAAAADSGRKAFARLAVAIDSVDYWDASALNFLIDRDNPTPRSGVTASNTDTTGTVRWDVAALANGIVPRIFWVIPVGGC